MATVADILAEMRNNPQGLRFADVRKVAEHYFGVPRMNGSHYAYKTPWPLDPRVNLQPDKGGKAKAYQVRQLLLAINKQEVEDAKKRKKHGPDR